MRILFLHEVGYLEKPIFEMHEFPENLAKKGHDVGFVDFLEKPENSRLTDFGELIRGRVLKQCSLRLFSQSATVEGVFGRLLAVFTFSRHFKKAMSEFKPDLVVSYSVPTTGWQALRICKRLGVPFLFRALDVSHKIRRTAFSPLVKLAEQFIYKNSNWVSCNNFAMRQYCISLGAREERSSVELPPLDLSHFLGTKQTSQRLRAKLGIPENSTVIVYMGSFFYFSGLDRIIEDLSKLAEKPQLVLIGGGEQDAYLRELVNSLKLEDSVTFTGFVGFDELPSYLSIADVAINPMRPSLVAHAALPNKVLQYMASGLPVVSTYLNGLSSLFPDAEGLKMVKSPEEVLEESISLTGNSNLPRMGKSNRKLVVTTFALERTVDAFEELVAQVRRS